MNKKEQIFKTLIMKSELFKIAHSIKQNYSSFGQALAMAWKVMKLKFQMKLGEVKFKFKKADGSIREALGTLKITFVKGENNKTKARNYGQISYFDLQQGEYRSFKAENLI